MEKTHLSIAALALETGIAKDTLRMWERRYGFPQPVRSPRGERRYPAQQVTRLRQMRRLLDQGMRPGQVLTLSGDELEQAAARQLVHADAEWALIALIKRHDDTGLRQELRARVLREGLRQFVCNTAAAMLERVGDGWARGALFGLVAYATYDLTNQATVRDWLAAHPSPSGRQLAEAGYSVAVLSKVFASKDAIEGATAFAEKRAPQWKGR